MKTASKCLIYNSATNSIVCCHPTGRPWKEKGSNNPAKGVFNLPGGEIDEGETPEDAMIREIKEELSYTLDKSRLQHIGPYDYTKDKNWEVFFYSVEDDFDIKKLKCDSFFSTSDGKILPEVNGFAWIEIESKLDWINFAAQKVIKKVLKDYGDKLFNTLDK
ncbi:MAG: NUDIX domain-containing protein [Lachnospiraceae bacterium]|jgi:8-oxo-dGTP pyrophosphatase MutT (NUDIX family)|nr:NUDIX domain-containing protein [Lachnospiraceae bacterium]